MGDHAYFSYPLARMRLSMPATTDYRVNDAAGDPLFVVTAEENAGMTKMLPGILEEVRTLVGERRVTIVFDRGGYSPKLLVKLIGDGFDILTYRKGRTRRVAGSRFSLHEAVIGSARCPTRWRIRGFACSAASSLFVRSHASLMTVTRLPRQK